MVSRYVGVDGVSNGGSGARLLGGMIERRNLFVSICTHTHTISGVSPEGMGVVWPSLPVAPLTVRQVQGRQPNFPAVDRLCMAGMWGGAWLCDDDTDSMLYCAGDAPVSLSF